MGMGNDYTPRDLAQYGGFIGGASIFMLSTPDWDVHRLVRLLCAVVVGMLIGYVTTNAYDRFRQGGGGGGGGGDGGGSGSGDDGGNWK
ncbi:MAG: hypothetical protein ACKV2Q_13600 [Planctomycetaceae bacterium]